MVLARRLGVRCVQNGSADMFRAGRGVAPENRAAIRSAGSTPSYGSAKPRDAVSAMAVSGKVWCNEKFRRPVEGGTPHSALERSVSETAQKKGDPGLLTRLPQALTEVPRVRGIQNMPKRGHNRKRKSIWMTQSHY